MILLDTHVWIWWCHGDRQMSSQLASALEFHSEDGLAVSAISCWEVSKLVQLQRLVLPLDLDEWFDMALGGSDVSLFPLTPSIAAASSRLPGDFHRDPADQMIVATSRVHDLPLATMDGRIRAYPHVRLLEDLQIHDG